MTNQPATPVMAEDAAPAPAAPPAADQQTTVELPLAATGPVKSGDTVSLKVVSVDEQNGVVNATPMKAGAEEQGEPQGSDDLAMQLDKPKG